MKINSVIQYIKNELVLFIAAILAILTSFFATPKLSYIDFKVLILLFNLMIVIAAFKEFNIMNYIASIFIKNCSSYKNLTIALLSICFFSSMIVTNDVSLITFVPLTLIICSSININPIKIIVLETIASNLGSALTPMGNPQNLFLYSYFNISPLEFFKITFPLTLLSLILLIIIALKGENYKLDVKVSKVTIKNKRLSIIFFVLFIIILLSVFHLINYKIVFVMTIITTVIFDKKLLIKIDYSLLITFVAFFIFIGNISSIETIRIFISNILNNGLNTYIGGIISSQFISNVPATMLLSGFTDYYKELLLSVNIGGLGTLIASLASVISYKLYSKEFSNESTTYLKKFTKYNFIFLIILTPIIYLLIL
ncbi:arsenical pump membrane protein [Clostridium bornimense]|uniref:Arsenical pump membrane protein n=1 Tax=Clostridium bornimense TaxID=1216932 RepID=W6RZL9_9CLOT|nr:SLC13 family permease [Clostridium bornimense]CDM67457.1 arsenical pump membrane protein [Clostridium bornimense]